MLNIYKASAGSGKTFTLARDYIRLILGRKRQDGSMELHPNPSGLHRAILAITFTNKATEEMKTRIIHELAVIAGLEPGWTKKSEHAARLIAEFGCTHEALRESAGIALRNILYDYTRFNISTIDAFFQSVLRTFAHEVDLPGNYDLELDDRFVVATGVNNMLTAFNLGEKYPSDPGNRRLESWIGSFLHSEMREGKSFNIFNRQLDIHNRLIELIAGFLNEEFDKNADRFEEYFSSPDKLVTLSQTLNRRLAEVRAHVSAACRDALSAIEQSGLKSKTNETNLLSRGNIGSAAKTTASLAEDGTRAFYAKDAPSPEAQSAAPFIQNAAQAMIRCDLESNIILSLRGNLFVLGLLGRVLHHMNEFTRENRSLLLKDTNNILNRIIKDDPVPFIYERVGVNISHFLIDEFQDTSRMQWENLRPLLDESLAYEHDNLIIGDEKQSIYRFRNADPTLLGNLHTEFPQQSRITGNNVSGNTNWRSAADIVRFNNTFYSILASDLQLTDVYINVVQQISPRHENHPGYVKFIPYVGADDKSPEECAFDASIAEIRRQIEAGYRPCDIGVLFRKRSVAAKFITRLISTVENNTDFPRVSVLSDDSLLVFSSPAVQEVVSTMRMLSATDHVYDSRNVSMKVIARLHTHFDAGVNSGMTPSQALANAIALRDTAPRVEGLDVASSAEVSTIEGVARIIIEGIDPERRKNENAYLTAFMDLVNDFASRGSHDLRSFINWIDNGQARNATISPGSDINAIRVLTIHKAKGLDYKCVHLPYLDGKTRPPGPKWFVPADADGTTLLGIDRELLPPLVPLEPAAWMENTVLSRRYTEIKHERLLDAVNVLYVGFTRAVDELIVGIATHGGAAEGSGLIVPVLEKLTHDESVSGLSPRGLFTTVKKNDDGTYTVGAPTLHESTAAVKGSRTALEPTSTMAMPPIRRRHHDSLWKDTKIEDSDNLPLLPAADVAAIIYAGRIITLRDLKAEMTRDINAGRLNAETAVEVAETLEQRINMPGVSQWYSDSSTVLRNRVIDSGNRRTARADRIVFMSDGSVDVIQFYGRNPDDSMSAENEASYCAHLLRRMGYGKVFAWIWNPASDTAPRRAAFRKPAPTTSGATDA